VLHINKGSNVEILLKTSTSLRYATPVEKKQKPSL